jgi:hypothetical protein
MGGKTVIDTSDLAKAIEKSNQLVRNYERK